VTITEGALIERDPSTEHGLTIECEAIGYPKPSIEWQFCETMQIYLRLMFF
jgi:hypothetical protein